MSAVAFPSNLLNDDEELILDLRPHWLYIVPASAALLGATVLTLLGIFWWSPDGTLGTVVTVALLVLLVAALGFFAWDYAKWVTTLFVLTSGRILTRSGVISKEGIAIPLDRVNTVFSNQSAFERVVGAGDLVIESAGSEGRLDLHDIRKPSIVQKEIDVQRGAVEDRRHQRYQGSGPRSDDATTPRGGGIPEQIDQLAELHQRGVLSDSEYARKKAELLDRM
jgi:uncharacterized membrane protein YdbT with pleckstrin-like domain